MIRSPQKIRAIISNAQAFQRIREEAGSFSEWLWSFTKGRTVCYMGHEKGTMPPANALSDQIATELKKRGFKYLGPVTVYSHLQACGIINDHLAECFCYQDIITKYPTVRKRRNG